MAEKPPPSWWPRDIGGGSITPYRPLGSQWTLVEEPLNLEKLYDLVRIAHETTDPQVKEIAIGILMRALHPAARVA